MYHNIEDLCNKVDVIKEKADKLRLVAHTDHSDPQYQFELEDIQALCADIANDIEK